MNDLKSSRAARMALLNSMGLGYVMDSRLIEQAQHIWEKTHCSECKTRIPPGKPGRKCKTCRSTNQ